MIEPDTATGAERDELLALLAQGPQAFNAWRVEHPDDPINLAGASLGGLRLPLAFLSGASLAGADPLCANLMAATLSGADFTGADFSGANLRAATFGPPDGVDMRTVYSPIGKRVMWGATLHGAVTCPHWTCGARALDKAILDEDQTGPQSR